MSNLNSNTFYIEPEDVVFFKDAGSFNLGEDDYAISMFPPNPSVVYGALQSIAYSGSGNGNDPDQKTVYPVSDLVVNSISVTVIENGIKKELFPLPDDLVIDTINTEEKINGYLSPFESKNLCSAGLFNDRMGVLQLLTKTRVNEEIDGEPKIGRLGLYFDREGLLKYLNGELPGVYYAISKYITFETRVGLGRNVDTRIAKEGALYTIKVIRTSSINNSFQLSQVGFNVTFSTSHELLQYKEGKKFKIRFGGERKLASCISIIPFKIPPINFVKDDIIKAYFITPGIYTDWSLKKYFENNGLEVFAIANKKAQHIGGWDIAARRPKPTFKAIPQGAVFFLKISDYGKAIALQNTGAHCIVSSDMVPADCIAHNQGFGIFFLSKSIKSKN